MNQSVVSQIGSGLDQYNTRVFHDMVNQICGF